MNHRFFACVAVALVACVAVGIAAGGVAAQDDGPENVSIDVEDDQTYAQEIDDSTRLVEWEYDDDRGGFELIFETDHGTQITLTEAVQFSDGAGSGRIYQHRLPEGTSEVFVSVERRGGEAAVTMTTPGSIDRNRFAFVSTGEQSPDRPPISYERAQILIFLTGIGAVGATIGVVKKRREDEDQEWRRVL